MTIWTTGIIQLEVNDAFFETRKFLQTELSKLTLAREYNYSVAEIRVVFVVSRDIISDFKRFLKKDKVLDIRVNVDYDAFLNSTLKERVIMLVDALIKMVREFNSLNQDEFDKIKLINDIYKIKFLL